MRIALVSEISAVDKNRDVLEALSGTGHEIVNLGMAQKEDRPELLYIHTGFISALVLNLGMVDFVVGGCGTGQGYLNAVMQYPGVVCGYILTPLDAWLFAKINAGNCISLPLNQGYGWAGNVNLGFLFDRLFSAGPGCGYPPDRRQAQKESRDHLKQISLATHRSMAEIIRELPQEVLLPALGFPRLKEFVSYDRIRDEAIRERLGAAGSVMV